MLDIYVLGGMLLKLLRIIEGRFFLEGNNIIPTLLCIAVKSPQGKARTLLARSALWWKLGIVISRTRSVGT